MNSHDQAREQARNKLNGQFGEQAKTDPGGDVLASTDWLDDPDIVAALGGDRLLNSEDRHYLGILIDPELDEHDDSTAVDLAQSWERFTGGDTHDIGRLADRLQLHHEPAEADQGCWVFIYADDEDSGWYEVGSYLPGTMLHVTLGDDGKYLLGERYGLSGLRAAIHAAATIDRAWASARSQMRERGLLTAEHSAGEQQ